MSVSTTNWLATLSTTAAASATSRAWGSMNPTKLADTMTQRFLKRNDKDKDGSLTQAEIPGLAKEAFKKLDADGDGKLSTSEIKAAVKKHVAALADVFQNSDSEQTVASLQATAEGQLVQAMGSRSRSVSLAKAALSANLSTSTKLDVTA